MKEVTPDSSVLKSSVFHRLIQRAFPEWFSYDAIQFFHPFYTRGKNIEYAGKQEYGDPKKKETYLTYLKGDFKPTKPVKPVYISRYAVVKAILSDELGIFANPGWLDKMAWPEGFEAIQPRIWKAKAGISPDRRKIIDYFSAITREIVKREVITIPTPYPKVGQKIFQIDATREYVLHAGSDPKALISSNEINLSFSLAIPVITRFFADFLGFSDRMKTEANTKGEFTENEIYAHITNCQEFFAYNIDETKMWKRRMEFKKSMKVLYELAKDGAIVQAGKWAITKAITSAFTRGPAIPEEQDMKDYGVRVAQRILEEERNHENAAAILLLITLDGIHNLVLAVRPHFHPRGTGQSLISHSFRRSWTSSSMIWQRIRRVAIGRRSRDWRCRTTKEAMIRSKNTLWRHSV